MRNTPIAVSILMLLGTLVVTAQQRDQAPSGAPPTIPSVPPGATLSVVPPRPPSPGPSPVAERPERLMQAQALVWQAYPELQQTGLQMRIEEGAADLTVTVGEAWKDRDDLLGLSRPRAAKLVGTFTFDGTNRLQRATLTGELTRVVERKRVRALPGGWAEALDGEQAAFAPGKQQELLQQLDVAGLRTLVADLVLDRAQFLAGTAEDPLYWEVTGTTPLGEIVRLGYEPYQGRLVRFERVIGGGR